MVRLSGPLILITEIAPPAGVAGAQIVSFFLIILNNSHFSKINKVQPMNDALNLDLNLRRLAYRQAGLRDLPENKKFPADFADSLRRIKYKRNTY